MTSLQVAALAEAAAEAVGANSLLCRVASYYHDIEPCLKKKIPVIWVNRHKQQLEPSQKKPDAEVGNLREAAKLIRVT